MSTAELQLHRITKEKISSLLPSLEGKIEYASAYIKLSKKAGTMPPQ